MSILHSFRRTAGAAAALTALVLLPLSAQQPDELSLDSGTASAYTAMLKNAPESWQRLYKKSSKIGQYNILRILRGQPRAKSSTTVWYSVPPLSNIQRLPDQFPVDGKLLAPVDIVMAQDEFEPGSFQLWSAVPQNKLQITVGDLKGDNGAVIKASDVDIKVIKVWYQNGNAWYNYFSDTTHKLVPELLLNDENLIRVDTVKQENYLRVNYQNGEKYIWISAPQEIDPGFNCDAEPVSDAKTLQPVQLVPGEFKQFFVTVRTTDKTKPGLYTGTIKAGSLAEIPLRVRVMPFKLPAPKTYYDLSRDFYTMLYCVGRSSNHYSKNGHDRTLANQILRARLVNQKNHNVTSPLYMGMWNGYTGIESIKSDILLAKEVGMKMDPFFEAYSCAVGNDPEALAKLQFVASVAKKEIGALVGHTNLWPAGGEEPGYGGIVGTRPGWKMVHDMGMHVMCNGGDRRNFSGYNDEFRIGGGFATKDEADFMHRIKGRIGNYAGPHTGPENPDYMRRHHGLWLYKKDYDMMYNYGYHEGAWNDFHLSTYRCFNLVQYTKDGIIDTLAWEGIREGLDDIRYATLMLTLAEQAVAKGTTEYVYAGKKAMQFMALLKEDEADLPAARMEMIRHIMTLKSLLEKGI